MRISDTQSRAIFGNPSPPVLVTEHQFDYFDGRLAEDVEIRIAYLIDGLEKPKGYT